MRNFNVSYVPKTNKKNLSKKNTKLKFFLPIIGLSHRRNFNYKNNFNFVFGLIKEHYLIICDHTFINSCSSLAFSNILIFFEVKISVSLILFPFKTFLFLYILFLVLYLAYFTVMGRGLAFLNFFAFPRQCDLSASSGLIFSFVCSSITFIDNSLCLYLLLYQPHE